MFAFLHNRMVRNYFIQAVVLFSFLIMLAYVINNAAVNLSNSGITSGFGFLYEKSGYDINFSLIEYNPRDATHLDAWIVSTINTIFFSVCAIIATTILALFFAISRLSDNWLLARVVTGVIEYIRNVPILVHIFIWYEIYLLLPVAREAMSFNDFAFLSNRGLVMPDVNWLYNGAYSSLLAAVIILSWVLIRKNKIFKANRVSFFSVICLFVFVAFTVVFGSPLSLSFPRLQGFNFSGGMTLPTEFLVLFTAVTVYSAAHCSEVIRGGILAVSKGQTEAALALGVKPNIVMREIIIPQALRSIIPPLTSIYINVLKAAALGSVIGFIDLMGAIGGSSLNITGQAIECIIIVMLTYSALNLILSMVMGRLNHAVMLKER